MAMTMFSIALGVTVLVLLLFGLLRGSTGIKLLCGMFLLLVVALVVVPSFPTRGTRDRARAVHCANNLRQIGVATRGFQHEHGDAFPHSLLDLTNAIPYPTCYVCKSTGHMAGKMADVSEWTDYVFVFPPGTNGVLAYCPPKNHRNRGGNIVFVDASVMWYKAEDFTNVLRHGRQRESTQVGSMGSR